MEKQNHNEIINTLSMASPFSLEEKQILLESPNLSLRKEKLEKILETYGVDNLNTQHYSNYNSIPLSAKVVAYLLRSLFFFKKLNMGTENKFFVILSIRKKEWIKSMPDPKI